MSRAAPATAWSPVPTGTAIRRIVLEQAKRANVGHIGSALSIADIVAALYGHVLRIPAPRDPDRDRFVLAKGHAVLAVYATLFLRGWRTGAAAGRRRPDDGRQGRLFHGRPDPLALRADVRRRVPARARRAGLRDMRAAFVRTLVELAAADRRIILLTGDLGFMALEP